MNYITEKLHSLKKEAQFRSRFLNCGCKNRNLYQFYHMITVIKRCLFLIFFIGTFLQSQASVSNQLFEADSLFEIQKYTEALTIYKGLLEEQEVSASMLLKMAFIQDASGDFSEALYYLDLYYRKTADRHAVGKIEELASSFDLVGYRYDDMDYFQVLLTKFKIPIVLLLLSFSVLLMAYIINKSRQGIRAYVPFVFQIFSLALLFGVINVKPSSNAIITVGQTLLRDGPSAGAEPLQFIEKGHKVTVLGTDEVWTKILWDGSEVFVRNNRLKLI